MNHPQRIQDNVATVIPVSQEVMRVLPARVVIN